MGGAAVRVVAAVILDDAGRLLIAQRPAGKRQAGLWELPGGKVEPGEDDPAALRRELAEELGVDLLAREFLAENVHTYPHLRVRLVAWRCALAAGSAPPRPLEHAALRWLDDADTLPAAVAWAPADVPLLDAVAEAMRAQRSRTASG